MKMLLINPRFPESLWSMQWVLDNLRPNLRTISPPLGLATVAALAPADWEIQIIDENIETMPLTTDADIVGVGGMAVQFDRQMEIVRHFQAQGHTVIVGGSYASLCPERYEGQVESVISGEAEYIFKQFCADFLAGAHKPVYREDGVVDLADSPTPRFDLLQLERYRAVTLQFSRGCPFRCEFCDIIVMFGRKPRTKSPEQVGAELDALAGRGVEEVFFTDDNFIGHRPKALKLLHYLADYQRERGTQLRFGTEASVDLAQHAAIMDAMVAAGFAWVFMGIETPDPASLAETQKDQNLREDLLEAVHRVYSHGLDIYAGFIIGFDNDTVATFDLMRDFINASGVQMANLSMLQAIPHTPLYERLEKEGRLREGQDGRIDVRLYTNVEPKGMSYEELVSGYRQLYLDLYTDEAIAARVKVKRQHLRRQEGDRGQRDVKAWLKPLSRVLTRGVLAGGRGRTLAAASTLRGGGAIQALIDWAMGLSVCSYLDRHFNVDDAEARAALARAEAAFGAIGARSGAQLTSRWVDEVPVSVTLKVRGDGGARAARALKTELLELMRRGPYGLELHLAGGLTPAMEKLLALLRPYGTRVLVFADPGLVADPRAELWRFRVALPEPVGEAAAAK